MNEGKEGAARQPQANSGRGRRVSPVLTGRTAPLTTDDAYTLPCFMTETNGGGSPEHVPGFDLFRAVTAGFETRRIAGPTMLVARPDGGFFSQGGVSMAPP